MDLFPGGALHPFNVELHQVSFADNGVCYDIRQERFGQVYLSSLDELGSLLKCFGIVWTNSETFDDALQALADDYERRSAELCARHQRDVV